jgi:hypothetical protein
MTALTDRLLNNLRIRLPGATDGAIRNEMWNALNELCREAGIWREVVEIQLNEGTTQYPITAPAGAEVVHILDVRHNGLPVISSADGSSSPVITMRGRIEADTAVDDTFSYDADAQGGSGTGQYAIYEPQYITITNPPDSDTVVYPLLVVVTLAPVLDVLDQDFEVWAPDWVWSKYHSALLDGCLGMMMSQLAKPYSSERMAIYHLKRFINHKALAKPEAEKNGRPRSQAWRFPRGGFI